MISEIFDWIKNYTLTPHSSIIGIGVSIIVLVSVTLIFYTPKNDQQPPPL